MTKGARDVHRPRTTRQRSVRPLSRNDPGATSFAWAAPACSVSRSARCSELPGLWRPNVRPRRRPRLGQGQERHHGLPPGRTQPPRPLGPQGERAGQRPQRLQADPHQDARRQFHRDPAQARQGERQVHHDPLDELHAQRPVQSHRRHLPDADRLHHRQGQPVRPARAAQPQGLSQLRLQHHPAQAADRADAAVRHDAPAAAGEQRRRQGRHRRFPGQGVRSVHALSPTATTWT